jgi:predicted peptidase
MSIPRLEPGVHRRVFEPLGVRYTLHVPDACDPEQASPLVLALHWGGPVAPFTGGDLLEGVVEPALGDLGAVLLAPDRTGETWTTLEAEREVLGLLDAVEGAVAVDRRRVLLTGYSLGGIGTWHLARLHPDRFSAAVPISASPPEEAEARDWPLPLCVIHGRRDELFPFEETARFVDRLRRSGADVEFIPVEGATHFETGRFVQPLARTLPWIRNALQ